MQQVSSWNEGGKGSKIYWGLQQERKVCTVKTFKVRFAERLCLYTSQPEFNERYEPWISFGDNMIEVTPLLKRGREGIGTVSLTHLYTHTHTHTHPFIQGVLDPPKSPSSQPEHKALTPDGPLVTMDWRSGGGGLGKDSTAKAYLQNPVGRGGCLRGGTRGRGLWKKIMPLPVAEI